MRYLLQVYFNGADQRLEQLPEAEREAIVQEYEAFFQHPEVKDGNQLQPPATATTIRVHEGEVARSTGASAPGEPLGGYYVVDVSDMNAAVAIAVHIPAVHMGAAIEVRPLVERQTETNRPRPAAPPQSTVGVDTNDVSQPPQGSTQSSS